MINRIAISQFDTLTWSQIKTILKGVQPVKLSKHSYTKILLLHEKTIFKPRLNLKPTERVMKGL